VIDKGELYPMEIRVIVELPEDVFDKYADLKTKRKLTSRVQEAITSYEKEDEVGDNSEKHIGRLSTLEDAIIQMTKTVSVLISHSNEEKEHRNKLLQNFSERMDKQDQILSGFINNTSVTNSIPVVHNIVSENKNASNINNEENKIDFLASPVDTNDNTMLEMEKKLAMLKEIEMLTNKLNNDNSSNSLNSNIINEEETPVIRTVPSKNVRNKLSKMMDI
jgi:hypothetical protein